MADEDAQVPGEDQGPPPPAGLAANKVLKEPFRHATKHYIILPKGTSLSQAMVDAIGLMGAERQALACLGEPLSAEASFSPDILDDAPKTIRKIDGEARVVRTARDLLAILLFLLAVFAFFARPIVLFVVMLLSLIGWAALGVIAYRAQSRIAVLVKEMDESRARRQKGEALLRDAATRSGIKDRSG